MNVKEYISSGILEAYLLGSLDAIEMQEVEYMIAQHPEVKAEADRISEHLELLTQRVSIDPPSGLRNKILERIDEPKSPDGSSTPPSKKSTTDNLQLTGLILFTLLVVTAVVLYNCLNTRSNLQSQITQLQATSQQQQQSIQDLTTQLDRARNDVQIMSNPDYNRIELAGQPFAPQSFAQVFWNQQTRDVYLNPTNLTTPPQNQQYQLWAIVGSQPVSIGVFDLPLDGSLIKMDSVANAAAFAITLEPQGGVEQPTLENMVVLGAVES